MQYIDEISKAVIILIRAGAVCRVAFCFFKLITADEEAVQYKKRIRNMIIFYAIAELAYAIKSIVMFYFS